MKYSSVCSNAALAGLLLAILFVAESVWALECPKTFSPQNIGGEVWCARIDHWGTNGQGNEEAIFRLTEQSRSYYDSKVGPCEQQYGVGNCGALWNGSWTDSGSGAPFLGSETDDACPPTNPNCTKPERASLNNPDSPVAESDKCGGTGQAQCDANGQPQCRMPNEPVEDPTFAVCDPATGKPELAGNDPGDPLTDPEAAIGQNGAPNGFPQAAEVASDRNYCEDQRTQAQVCCTNPIQCVSGLSAPSASAVTAVGSVAIGALGLMAMNNGSDASGMAENCKLMKNLGMGGAAANTALGAKCFAEKQSCESKCQEVVTKYKKVVADCDALKASGGQGCTRDLYSDYTAALANAAARKNHCTGYNANVAAMGNQAVQSAAAMKMAELCEDAATAQSTGFPNIDQQPVFNGDCSDPVNASNPICVRCRGPAANSDPLCRGLNGGTRAGTGSSSNFSQADFGSRKGDGSDLNVPDMDAQKQDSMFGGGGADQARANAVPQNGGGFTGGSGGGGGMPFGGGGGRGGGQGGGYDTDIMKGVGGGGGYTVSGVGVASRGGYRGPSSTGKLRDKNPFKKFNLKKYLPGGEKDPKRRGLAGLQTGKTEIGKPHEDIFQRVTNRVKVLCKMKRLYDCK